MGVLPVEALQVTAGGDPLSEGLHFGMIEPFIEPLISREYQVDSGLALTLDIGQTSNFLQKFERHGLSFVDDQQHP